MTEEQKSKFVTLINFWNQTEYPEDAKKAFAEIISFIELEVEGKWIDVREDKPPVNTVVLGYNKLWIDEDYEPEGIRECFYTDENEWCSARWNNSMDEWIADRDTSPTYWMQRPEPPTVNSITKTP